MRAWCGKYFMSLKLCRMLLNYSLVIVASYAESSYFMMRAVSQDPQLMIKCVITDQTLSFINTTWFVVVMCIYHVHGIDCNITSSRRLVNTIRASHNIHRTVPTPFIMIYQENSPPSPPPPPYKLYFILWRAGSLIILLAFIIVYTNTKLRFNQVHQRFK